MKITKFIARVDVSRHVSHHLVGADHTMKHRRIAGLIIMALGVGLTKIPLLAQSHVLHYIADLIGYAIHGIGLIPYATNIEKDGKPDKQDT